MMMPFVRLLAIYAVVGLAIFSFFNRDEIVLLMGSDDEQPMAEETPTPEETHTTQTASTTQATTQITEPASTSDLASGLNDARRAFWNGDAEAAEEIYLQLVAAHPDSEEVNGELGNILFTKGRFNEAAIYYFKVGELSHKAGNNSQLMTMIGVLQGIAPAKAEELRSLSGIRPLWAPAGIDDN